MKLLTVLSTVALLSLASCAHKKDCSKGSCEMKKENCSKSSCKMKKKSESSCCAKRTS